MEFTLTLQAALPEVTTVEQFATLLRRLYVRTGYSYRDLANWAKEQQAVGRREVMLARSTVSETLNGTRLPSKHFVSTFVEACQVPEGERDSWLTAWERVAEHCRVLTAPPRQHQRAVPAPSDSDALVNAGLEVLCDERLGDGRATESPSEVRALEAMLEQTSTVLEHLGNDLGEKGHCTAAQAIFAQVVSIRVEIHGAAHRDTLAAQHSLACWTGEAGDAAAARDMFAELTPICRTVFGQEHPQALDTQHSFARWTGRAGDAATARDMFAELLPTYRRVLGSEHPETLITQHNLAYWTGEAGDAATARDMFADLLPTYQRVLGPDHPHTLEAQHSLVRLTAVGRSLRDTSPPGSGC